MKEITSKIKAFRVGQADAAPAQLPDLDPITLRIDRRPDGALEAVSEKIDYSTSEGRKRIYLLVSFMPVTGRLEGQEITVERPVEFFIPSGQLSSELQWVTASMRSLSLAARAGFVTKALQDLRKVTWDKGPVRCGKNQYGKPLYHSSEVAAIAWALQQILHRRGFLDAEGNQTQLKALVAPSVPKPSEAPEPVEAPVEGGCPDCGGKLTLMDGCPTCVEGCGWSKCG